jgi:hypothetical protein
MTDRTINLETFCNPGRPELARPFSIDAWTYASDGCVLVRVPRRDEIAECESDFAAKVHAMVCTVASRKPHYSSAPPFDLPERSEREEECFVCDGSGNAHHHHCPHCRCECPRCKGTGKIVALETVKIGNVPFNSKYVSWLQRLPNLELDRIPRGVKPLRFRFDGGEGLLMPCRA